MSTNRSINNVSRKLSGIILVILYLGISFSYLIGITRYETPEVRNLLVDQLEKAKNFEFPDALRELALREIHILFGFTVALIFILIFPLLIWGLRFLTGSNHILWSWQKNRINRHPIIAYLFLVFGIVIAYRFFQRILNPMNQAQMIVLQGGIQGEMVYFIAMLICVAISLWLYIGKVNPFSLAHREKNEEGIEKPNQQKEESPAQLSSQTTTSDQLPLPQEQEPVQQEKPTVQLSPEMMEKQVLHLISEGRRSLEIAKQIGIQPLEVGTIVSKLMNKYDATSIGDLLDKARQKGDLSD
jgi:DNA-binding CsgD family transcriptional regulator